MKHKCLLGLALAVSLLAGSAQAAETPDIELVGFDLDTLITADAVTIENTLYPTGMQLPTKYMDLLDVVPYAGHADMGDDGTQEFLVATYPEAMGKFTYAEYRAASRFINLCRLQEMSGMEVPAGFIVGGHATNAVLKDATAIHYVLSQYQDLLQTCAIVDNTIVNHADYQDLIGKTTGGFYLSYGEGFYWGSVTSEDLLGAGVFDTMGLMQEKMSVAQEQTDLLIGYDEETGTSLGAVKDKLVVAEPKVEPENVKPETEELLGKESGMQGIDNATSLKEMPEKTYNARDIVSIAALVFVVVSVAVLLIIDFVRKRKDPLSKYLK